MHCRITIIGAGNMGTSLLGGLIDNGLSPELVWISDPHEEKLKHLQQKLGVNISKDNAEACQKSDVIILAVKPRSMKEVTLSLASLVQQKKPLIISVAAAIRESHLQTWLGGNIPIVRCMPNTPALIRCGAAALFANSFVNETQHNLAESILRAVGIVVWVTKENLMDTVTALSGCGPAYFFLLIEVLQKVGEQLGLSAETARLLTLQTAYGAARMALESTDSASELRQKVASPGGSTEAALKYLAEKNFQNLFTEALQTAKNRAEEVANQFDKG